MEINWQNIFYITSSLAMIVFLIAAMWFMWLLFIASKLIRNLMESVHKWDNIVDDVKYFGKSIKSNTLRFLLKVLGKETKKI